MGRVTQYDVVPYVYIIYWGNISSNFSRNFESDAPEFLEDITPLLVVDNSSWSKWPCRHYDDNNPCSKGHSVKKSIGNEFLNDSALCCITSPLLHSLIFALFALCSTRPLNIYFCFSCRPMITEASYRRTVCWQNSSERGTIINTQK